MRAWRARAAEQRDAPRQHKSAHVRCFCAHSCAMPCIGSTAAHDGVTSEQHRHGMPPRRRHAPVCATPRLRAVGSVCTRTQKMYLIVWTQGATESAAVCLVARRRACRSGDERDASAHQCVVWSCAAPPHQSRQSGIRTVRVVEEAEGVTRETPVNFWKHVAGGTSGSTMASAMAASASSAPRHAQRRARLPRAAGHRWVSIGHIPKAPRKVHSKIRRGGKLAPRPCRSGRGTHGPPLLRHTL